ncbi:MAG: glycosyltransferase family 39 protein [Fibrobacteria bacterium]|nr:glycosyltransferase family 39 protein [Fibrobacteria bacterium]
MAKNLANGGGYYYEGGVPVLLYPPGFTLLLSALFVISDVLHINESMILTLFILLCTGISAIIIYRFSLFLWNKKYAFLSSMLWVCYPLFLWFTRRPSSELPFLVLFLGALYLFWVAIRTQKRIIAYSLLAGMLIGCAMLIRPIGIGLVFVLGFSLLFIKYQLKIRTKVLIIALMLLGNIAIVLPWELWVYQKTGKVVMLTDGSGIAMRDGLTFAVHLKGYRQGVKIPDDVREMMRDMHRNHYSKMVSKAYIMNLLRQKFRENPGAVIKLYMIKIVRSWYCTDSQRYELALLAIQIPFLLLSLLATYFALRRKKEYYEIALIIWLFVGYFWLMSILSLTLVRYLVPGIGLLFLLWPALIKGQKTEV